MMGVVPAAPAAPAVCFPPVALKNSFFNSLFLIFFKFLNDNFYFIHAFNLIALFIDTSFFIIFILLSLYI